MADATITTMNYILLRIRTRSLTIFLRMMKDITDLALMVSTEILERLQDVVDMLSTMSVGSLSFIEFYCSFVVVHCI
uniref:Uncharacterized protein n=1 Tax=Physcomitrium patens TaxID=3218 RepID=A0A2K1JT31_PHYPA|nr:hypothetical protein PHYPA_014405 [Physcomitrium patens]